MEPGSLTWLGSPCGSHGPYIFYKAFRFNLDGKKRLLSLGDFFLVRCQPGEPLCVAELQLLWEERTNHQLLSSSKLYFLPEDTPQGRSASHGQDEVIAVSEKVVVRLEDLVKWTVWDREAWNRGMKALPLKISSKRSTTDSFVRYHDPTLNGGLHFKDVMKEKAALGEGLGQKQVLVLSYPRYCRYRSVVARLREQPRSLLTNEVVLALGGIAVPSENTHILYCRDTFCHPTLLHNESICDEFAPNLKGRPRKKKLLNCLHRDSHDQSQGLEVKGYCQKSSKETEATAGETTVEVTADKAGVTKVKDSRISSVNHSTTLALPVERRRRGRGLQYKAEEQAFLVSLYKYMKERKTPIERIPYLGFKQINLWTMFQAAQSLGGYELITARRQWKNVYDELGGNPGSTSAATCTRRHYERLILPYERFIRGEEDKPVPQLKPGKLEASTSKGSSSSICTPILKTEACPEKNDKLESRDQDQSRLVLEQNSQLKLEPQICITRLDSLQPLLSVRKRQSPTQDSQNDPAIQLMQEHKEEVKRKRRYSGCDPSYLTTYPMTKGESVLPLATPKIFNHGHLAVDLWQHQQVPLQDLCHIGKPRNLQSPTIPEPPSEQAELPRTEDTSSGFTTLFESSGASKAIMSPLVKKKLLLQVSSTGLPKQGHCHSNFGQSPPLITPSSTNCITEEPAERPAVAADSSVSRPSVIQHVQSFKTTVQKDRARQVKESTPPVNSHKHHFHLVPPSHSPIPLLSHQKESQCPSTPLLTPKMPQSSWTPRAFPIDLFSSVSYLDYRHRAAEKADGTVNVELVHDGSKQPQEQEATLPRDPKSLVRFLQSDDDSKYSTPTDQGNSPNPRTLLSDDQPTDLSLPKSSLKPLHHPCPSGPLKYSTRYQDSTPVLPQNGLTDINIAHYLRAWRVPPLSVSLAHTCNPRRDPAAERFRATEEAVVGTVHNGEVVKKQKVGDKEEQEQLQTALYNRMRTEALGSQMVLHNACVAHSLNNLGNSISKRRRQTITPIPEDVLSSSPSREIETPKDDSVVGESAEGAEGGAPASPFSILNPTSQVYPNILNPSGTLALYQVQNLCRDTFSIPLIMDQPHCSKSHLQNPLQYLKTQSTDFDSSLVPPIAIHSSIAQRQLLVQASASPIHIYQQTYGDVLHHKLYPMSVNPHPTFSQPPSVHPSTKLP